MKMHVNVFADIYEAENKEHHKQKLPPDKVELEDDVPDFSSNPHVDLNTGKGTYYFTFFAIIFNTRPIRMVG